MPFITGEWEKMQPVHSYRGTLPQSYLDLLTKQNGGYVKRMRIQTAEPTSDGMDFALVHYICGLHEVRPYSLIYQEFPDLPDYLVVFSVNEDKLFAFDYSQVNDASEPAIRYLDLETDNWQTVAPDFTAFLAGLEEYEMEIPLEGHLTRFEAEHSLLLARDAKRVADLLLHLEAVPNKAWYLEWVDHFSKHPDEAVRQAALDALETQVLYFRLSLPDWTRELMQVFLQDESAAIREQARAVERELE